MSDSTASRWYAVRLVTAREVRARVANRSFLVGTLVTGAIIVGLLFYFGHSGSRQVPRIALTGVSAAALAPTLAPAGAPQEEVRWDPVASPAEARAQVGAGHVDAALVVAGDRSRLLVRADTPDQVRAAVTAVVQQWAADRALQAQHVDMARLHRQVAAALPHTETVGAGSAHGARLGSAVGIVTILFFQLFGYGTMVAQGVVEEKSTRVVEVLLSTLTPLRLMVGKVLGIGIAAVLQLAVFAAVIAGAARVGHLLPGAFPGLAATAAAVGWFVLGFLFYAFLYAAAGSLVSRAEEVGSAVMPLMMATMVPFGVAMAAVQDMNAGWVHVIRYIPPFSMLVMPLESSVGAADWQSTTVAAVLLVAAAAAMAAAAGRVYQRSILRVGAPLRWREALRVSA